MESEYFIEAIKSKVTDYVPKLFGEEARVKSVISAYEKGNMSLKSQWNEFRQLHTEQWRLVQNCEIVADRMCRIVSDGIGELNDIRNNLSRLLNDHYQLSVERDIEDPICQSIRQMNETFQAISKQSYQMRDELNSYSDELEKVNVTRIIQSSLHGLLPGIASVGLKVDYIYEGDYTVHSFKRDLKMIIDEIIYNAIEASDFGCTIEIKINKDNQKDLINICISDEAKPVEYLTHDRTGRYDPQNREGWSMFGDYPWRKGLRII